MGSLFDGVAGSNLIWIHCGFGFFIQEQSIEAEPGDVILFDRRLVHRVGSKNTYVRTVLASISPEMEWKYPRFLRKGIFLIVFSRQIFRRVQERLVPFQLDSPMYYICVSLNSKDGEWYTGAADVTARCGAAWYGGKGKRYL